MEKELEIFNNIISKYDMNDEGISRKYHHTFRVVDYAKQIGKSLNLNEEDLNLACICALFHDIGRFPQWSKYHTFRDSISIDHGDKSYDMLKEIGYNNDIVKEAVKYHNKYAILDSLDDRTKMYCNITRDADKLDIMFKQCLKCNDESLNVDKNIIKSIKEHKLVNNNVGETNDASSIIRCLAFIFDINYKESFAIIKEGNLINNKLDLLDKYHDNEMKEIRLILNTYLDNKLKEGEE